MTSWALVLVLVSAALHSSWNAATKHSGNPTAFLVAMELVSLVLFAPVLLFGFELADISPRLWGLIVVSACVHALYTYWLSRAYAAAELSLVYPIARSTPAFVPLVAWPLFGEVPSLAGAGGIALVVLGMWAVQTGGRLELDALRSKGARFAYLTLAMTVVYSLVDKEAMRLLDTSDWSGAAPRSLAYMALWFLLYLPLFLWIGRREAPPREVLATARRLPVLVAGAGLVGIVSYGLILEALRTAPVTYIVAVRQTSVLFAVAIGVVLLHERPGRLRLLGAVGIVLGVAAIALAA